MDELTCVECGANYRIPRDLELCDICLEHFDLERLWRLHDTNQIDALDFNESVKFRDLFRKHTPTR